MTGRESWKKYKLCYRDTLNAITRKEKCVCVDYGIRP